MPASHRPVRAVPIGREGAIPDRMKQPTVGPPGVMPGRNPLQHDDAIGLDHIGNAAFDIRQTVAEQRCLHVVRRLCLQPEFGEFVSVGAGTHADPDHRVEHRDRRDRDHAFPRLRQRGIGMVPRPGRDREIRAEVEHHGPGDRHDVRPRSVMRDDQRHRPGFDQGEGPVQRQTVHRRPPALTAEPSTMRWLPRDRA